MASAIAQQLPLRPNKQDVHGKRQGEWIILFDKRWNETTITESAQFYRLITYQNDLPSGIVRDYFRNGLVQWEGNLLKDRPDVYDGKQTWFYASGEKKSQALFSKGEVQGEVHAYLRDGRPAETQWVSKFYEPALDAVDANDYTNAAKLFSEALPHVEAIAEKESEDYVDLLIWLSLVYSDLDQKEKSLDYNLQACAIYELIRSPGDKDLLARIHTIARAYKFLNNYHEAEKWYRRFLEQEKKHTEAPHEDHGLALSGLADVLLESQHYRDALNLLNDARNHYQQHPPEDPMEIELMNSLRTRATFMAGEWTAGVRFLNEQLIATEKKFGSTSLQHAETLVALGNFLKMNGQLLESERALLRAQKILESKGAEAFVLKLSAAVTLIEVYCQLGLAHQADQYIAAARREVSTLSSNDANHNMLYAGFLTRVAQYYSFLGQQQKLEETLRDLIKLAEGKLATFPIEALSANQLLIDHYIRYRKWREADVLNKKSIDLAKIISTQVLAAREIRAIAKAYQQSGTVTHLLTPQQTNKSRAFLQESLAWYNRLPEQGFIPERIDSWLGLAMVSEEIGNEANADQYYEQSRAYVEATFGKQHEYYANMLFAIAKKAEVRNNTRVSKKYYKEAVERLLFTVRNTFPHLSIREREMFYEANKEWIDNFQSFALLHEKEDPTLADDLYNLLLVNKGIVIHSVNRIRSAIMNQGNDQLKQLYNDWQKKKNDLAYALRNPNATLAQTQEIAEQINAVEVRLAQGSIEFAQWAKESAMTWKNVQSALKKDEACVEIVYAGREIKGDSVYTALLITAESTHPLIIPIGEARSLDRQIKLYRNLIKFQQRDTLSYNAFWNPVAEKLQSKSKVYLSADGVFHQVSIGTLWNPGKKKYVIDEFQIINVTSTALVAVKKTGALKSARATVIAHPDFGSSTGKQNEERYFSVGEVSELPGTEAEQDAITALLTKAQFHVDELSEELASEERVKTIQNPAVLHIATHGFFLANAKKGETTSNDANTLYENPLLLSGLLFSGCNNNNRTSMEDGILTAFEASTMDLNQTELVVLSACETGLGEIKNGEGVYGLQRAFAMAGAKQMVMSLWKVDDSATKEFMIEFYRDWLKHRDAPLALANAQRTMKQKYPEPYYWGPFILCANY